MNWKFWKTDPHADAEALIQKSLDMPLSGSERQRLDKHLATCDACRSAWEDYRRLSRTADKWMNAASTDPGDDFTMRVMAELGIDASTPVEIPSAPALSAGRQRSTNGRLGLAVGAVALVAVLAVAGIYLPSIGHYQTQLSTYAPTLSDVSTTSLQPDSISTLASASRQQVSLIVDSLSSLSWPLYAFLAALAANVAMAGIMRQRRRAL